MITLEVITLSTYARERLAQPARLRGGRRFRDRLRRKIEIGGALVAGVLGLARRRGAERVWLAVGRENRRAAALYRRLGFRPVRGDDVGDDVASAPGARPADDVWALALSP